MCDAVAELVDAVHGLDQIARRPVQVGERGVESVVPEVLTARVSVGQEESPRSERELRQEVGVCHRSIVMSNGSFGPLTCLDQLGFPDQATQEWRWVEEPVSIPRLLSSRVNLHCVPYAELGVEQ